MKLLYIIPFLLLVSLIGCETEKPDMFVATHYIKFQFNAPGEEEYYRVDYNFAHASADAMEHVIYVPVEMKGYVLTEDLYFGITVDKEKTTLPDDCYDLKIEQPFRMGIGKVDSMRVTLLRKPILKEGELVLRLKLIANRDFQLYMPDSSFVDIHVEDIFFRPTWWDSAVEKAYLGEFSKKKYDLFVKQTNVFDFGALDGSEKRYYTIIFKRYLEKNPTLEDNGKPMEVTIAG